MGIKEIDGTYTVSVAKRHPITRMPMSLRRTNIKSRRLAEIVQKELLIQLLEKIKDSRVPRWGAILDAYEGYLLDVRGLSRKSVDNYLCNLRAHTLPDWSNERLSEISSAKIRAIVEAKVGHRSVAQQKNLLKFIKSVFSYAIDKGYLNSSPVPPITFKVEERLKKCLSSDQAMQLLESAKSNAHPWYYVWSFALYTGMRSGELYALRWENIDLETNTILINQSWNSGDGFKCTKAGYDRKVSIALGLRSLILELARVREQGNPFVLTRFRDWEKGEQARILRTFLRFNGLPEVKFHDLRATWCTMLLNNGVAPAKVRAMGGWKDLKTFEIYIRSAGIEIQGATDCLDFLVPGQQGGVSFLRNSCKSG